MGRPRDVTILIVDDDHDIVEAIRDVLEHEGYRVLSAINGEDAVRRLAGTRVDLILLDLMMPAMNGWEFLESSAHHGGSTPIVVISAAPSDALPETAHVVLRKPFERGALLELVARQTSGR